MMNGIFKVVSKLQTEDSYSVRIKLVQEPWSTQEEVKILVTPEEFERAKVGQELVLEPRQESTGIGEKTVVRRCCQTPAGGQHHITCISRLP